jgi:hypothetical protein
MQDNKGERGAMSQALRHGLCATDSVSVMAEETGRLSRNQVEFYCPRCHSAVTDPLMCGDCSALICRVCGAPLEKIDELGIG